MVRGNAGMPYDRNRHHRRSIRLKGYDYSREGAYFITLCTQDRARRFGRVVDKEMRLSAAGRMIHAVWNDLSGFYPGVVTDAFVVMPDHIHGILFLSPKIVDAPDGSCDTRVHGTAPHNPRPPINAHVGATPRGCPGLIPHAPGVTPNASFTTDMNARDVAAPDDSWNARRPGQARGLAPTVVGPGMSVGDVVHRFKSLTTRRYADAVKQSWWPAFNGRLWQRNYFECIIRDTDALDRIRRYIMRNPAAWGTQRGISSTRSDGASR